MHACRSTLEDPTIVAALYEARSKNEVLGTPHVRAEIKRGKPLSVLMAEQVQSLREWAKSRTVPAL